jgi:hypothetical protein
MVSFLPDLSLSIWNGKYVFYHKSLTYPMAVSNENKQNIYCCSRPSSRVASTSCSQSVVESEKTQPPNRLEKITTTLCKRFGVGDTTLQVLSQRKEQSNYYLSTQLSFPIQSTLFVVFQSTCGGYPGTTAETSCQVVPR